MVNDKEVIRDLTKLLDHTIYIGKTVFSDVPTRPINLYLICSGPLLIKALHKAYAINLLVSDSLLEEAEIILRVLIEVSFVIDAIEKKPEFLKKYGRSAYCQKVRQLENLKKAAKQKIPNLIVPYKFIQQLECNIEHLRGIIKKEKLKEIKIIDYAKEANLLSIYYSTYSQLCSSVHSGPEDLEPYFSKQNDGTILKISPPEKNNEELILFSAVESMIRILKSLAKMLSIKSEEIVRAEEQYHLLNRIIWNKREPNKALQGQIQSGRSNWLDESDLSNE